MTDTHSLAMTLCTEKISFQKAGRTLKTSPCDRKDFTALITPSSGNYGPALAAHPIAKLLATSLIPSELPYPLPYRGSVSSPHQRKSLVLCGFPRSSHHSLACIPSLPSPARLCRSTHAGGHALVHPHEVWCSACVSRDVVHCSCACRYSLGCSWASSHAPPGYYLASSILP